MKIEMHVHTKYSQDSMLGFWPLYIKLRMASIDVVAITDHNTIRGALEFKKFISKREKYIEVIVGEEIFSAQGEIIGLFLKEEVPKGLTAKETISMIKKQGGIVYIPHPYDEKRKKTVIQQAALGENIKSIDCIETHNGRNSSSLYDLKQKEICDKYNLSAVIGSDAHTWIEIGRNYMTCTNKNITNANQFIESLSELEFHQQECLKISHKITKVVKAIKMIWRGEINELYKSVNGRNKKTK